MVLIGIFSRTAWVTLLVVAICGCNRATSSVVGTSAPRGPEWFADVTQKLGVDFVHESGAKGGYHLPEIQGSGSALFDYDNDGRLDIYLIQNGGTEAAKKNQLYHQETDGRFKDVSAGSHLDIAGRGMGVAVGDVNNDGFPDVLVCEYGSARLFLNQDGRGAFSEVTEAAGIENSLFASSAAMFDYDRDGWLDLIIANYLQNRESALHIGDDGKPDYPHLTNYQGQVSKLYRNLGGGSSHARSEVDGLNSANGVKSAAAANSPLVGAVEVRFKDVTSSAGIAAHPGPGLGVVGADFDGDRWPDILVADDDAPNRLFINQRDGSFKNEAVVRGIAYNAMGEAQGNMGIAMGDVDGDGLADAYITHITDEGNILWKQGPPGMYRDVTASTGLATPQWRGTGFGTVFADFTNSGALDLAVVNGRVRRAATHGAAVSLVPELGPYWTPYGERNQLFANDGAGKFRDISDANPSFCAALRIGRGLAVGDIDNDGGLDLLVTNCQGPAKVYRNVAPNRGHWLQVRAVEPKLGGRDAYGAKVTITAGGRRRVGWINPGYSYQCSNDPRAHFGLGKTNTIEALEVEWPDGSQESFPVAAVDQLIVARHGNGHVQAKE